MAPTALGGSPRAAAAAAPAALVPDAAVLSPPDLSPGLLAQLEDGEAASGTQGHWLRVTRPTGGKVESPMQSARPLLSQAWSQLPASGWYSVPTTPSLPSPPPAPGSTAYFLSL